MKNLKVVFLSYCLLSFLVSHLENGTLVFQEGFFDLFSTCFLILQNVYAHKPNNLRNNSLCL